MTISNRTCQRCGTPFAALDQKLCSNCGALLFPSQKPERRSRPGNLAIGVLGLLLLLLIAGCLFLLLKPLEGLSHKVVHNATTTTVPSTPTPTPKVLFSDTFVDNSQNWNVGKESGYGSVIDNNMLTMTEANHKILREPIPSNTIYSDFSVTIAFTLSKGDKNDTIGLYLRANGDNGQGYYVEVNGDDSYDIAKIYVGANQKIQATYIAEPAHSPFLHPKGQQNIMTVILKGSSIVLLLNGSDNVVKTATDADFPSGKIMLFVQNGNSSDGAAANFESITVNDAPAQLPT